MTIKILSILMILIGAIFLFLSFSPARNIWGNVSGDLRRKWLIVLYLMGFFILGYLFFDIILIINLPFPVELVTGGVFLGGAFFVYIIIHISQSTIAVRQKAEEAIVLANDDWENTFDTVTDMITVHDMDFNIVRANPSAKSMLGLRHQEGIPSVKCFRCYHGTEKPPSGCASCQSLQTGKPSTVEIFEPYLNRHLEIRAMPRFGRDRQLVGLIHIVRDITERKRAEAELCKSEARFQDLFQEAPVGYFEYDTEGCITNVNQTELDMLGYPLEEMIGQPVWKFIVEEETARQQILAKLAGTLAPFRGFERTYRRKDGAIFPVLIQDRLNKDEQGNITGIRCAIEDITDRKQAEEALQRSTERLHKALGATVRCIAAVVETRDPYTAGHQKKVADLARAIAQEMGLPGDLVDGLRMAAVIHDIGKISVPAEILSKPAKLTDIEFSLIKIHPQSGYDILKDVEFSWPIARMVLEHHERMDGSGYPNALTGDQLLLESRILAVADVVESMASHRPYRPAIGIDAALEEIIKNRASLYDPEAVDACLTLFRERGYALVI
jgi:PAS domain S-box-containing protein